MPLISINSSHDGPVYIDFQGESIISNSKTPDVGKLIFLPRRENLDDAF